MRNILVYDPPMCCSTGVCGPNPSQELVQWASDLRRMAKYGIEVKRYNLSQQPGAFVQQGEVQKLLAERGPDILPVILVDGRVRLMGRYPTAAELEAWLKENDEERLE